MAHERPPYGFAALCALAVLVLYVVTLAPSTAWWDASEYIATAHTLGIPHPPGNPLFVSLARSWSILLSPFGLEPAIRINLFAAVTSAAAFFFFALVAHRTLRQSGASDAVARIGAAVSVLIGSTAYTVWSQSNANEKVYTLSVLVIAAVTWLVFAWQDRRADAGSERLLLWALYLMVLGSTSHLMSVLPLVAFGLFVLLVDWRVLIKPAFVTRGLLAVVVGLSFSFFLPIRAAERPVINEGDSLCESTVDAAVAIYSNGRKGCPALGASLQREQYQKPPLSIRMAPFKHQLTNFAQYFDWQWARSLDANEQPSQRRIPVSLLFLGLGLYGFWVAFKSDGDTGTYLIVLMGTVSVALVFYLNFEFGFSLAPEVTDRTAHEVRERDYFFLASFSLWGVVAGIGLTDLWRRLSDRLASPWTASPVLGIALVPLVLNWGWASRAGDYAPRDWAYNMLTSVEPYGVLFTNGDNDTFPLWYLQEVEGVRQDVTVAVVQYLFTDWYPKQLRELTTPGRQRPYVPVLTDFYEDPGPPEGPVLNLTDEQLAEIGDGLLPPGVTVPFGSVVVEYPEGMYLGSGHRIVLAMIAASWGERPIYFAGTRGEMAAVGLGAWGVQQGLVAKLMMRDLSADQPPGYRQTLESLGNDWIDLPRSIRLVDEVYSYRGMTERSVWPDAATFSIPLQYYFMASGLADVLYTAGDSARAEVYMEMAGDFLVTSQGGSQGQRVR